jgi:basic membrane protein A
MTCVQNGEAIAADWNGTIATGSVVLTDLGSAAAEGTAEAIEAATEELNAGTLHVFDTTTFTVGGETLTSYMADVDTDAAYTGDHEAIVDGYFAESADGFRSAPYFDVRIDGITLLDEAY